MQFSCRFPLHDTSRQKTVFVECISENITKNYTVYDNNKSSVCNFPNVSTHHITKRYLNYAPVRIAGISVIIVLYHNFFKQFIFYNGLLVLITCSVFLRVHNSVKLLTLAVIGITFSVIIAAGFLDIFANFEIRKLLEINPCNE